MKKNLLLFASLTLFINLNAQTVQFKPILPPSETKDISLMGIHVGETATADIDNDNDLDIIIIGENQNGHYLTNLYKNDGKGNFTIVTDTPFEGARAGSVEFADIDNDNDLDVLLSGQNTRLVFYTKLYKNDGAGNFTLVENTPFAPIYYGAIKFADVDGDNDLDVFLTGNYISKLYLNDGQGNFTESSNIFTGVSYGSADVADVDGDLDIDIILTGYDDQNIGVTKLYVNNGLGLFSEDTNASSNFEQVYFSCVTFGDADGDNDNDILLIGLNNSYERVTKLYRNDSAGSFTLDTNNTFTNVCEGSVLFADLDNDGDKDIYLAGTYNSFGEKVAEIYKNDGGSFSKIVATPFDLVTSGSAEAKDIDGDNDLDIVAIGSTSKFPNMKYFSDFRTSNIFINQGNMNFNRAKGCSIKDFSYSQFDYADVDLDNDLDVVIAGTSENGLSTIVYKNDETGNFVEYSSFLIPGSFFYGSLDLADVNGDSKPDLLIAGIDNDTEFITKLYLNNGNGDFSIVNNTPFVGLKYSTSSFFDIDNDGDLDLLLTGETKEYASDARLYKNNGSGTFAEEVNVPFEGVREGSVAISDVDGDNDLDVLIAGYQCISIDVNSISFAPSINLYTNNGEGVFTKSAYNPFPTLGYCSVTFEDVDNDGDKDLLLTGGEAMFSKYSSIYKNDGTGVFSEDTNIFLLDVDNAAVSFGNINGDSFIDLIVAGYTFDNKEITSLYTNDGLGGFSKVESVIMEGLSRGSVALMDIDNDGDDDVLTSGSGLTKLYRNTTGEDISTDIDDSQIQPANDLNITLLPNPTNGDVAINSKGDDIIEVTVFNPLGTIIFEASDLNTTKYNVRIDGTQGLYFVKVSTKQFEKIIKVIKK